MTQAEFLDTFLSASASTKLVSALTALGLMDTVLRRIPYARSVFVYLAKAFGIGVVVCTLGQKGSFWVTDQISRIWPDVRVERRKEDEPVDEDKRK